MEKRSVNLIIKKDKESPFVTKLKIFLPVAAAISLLLFIGADFASIMYINKNIRDFDTLKLQINKLEKQISDNKNIEGIYTLTLLRLKILEQLKSNTKNYSNLLAEILKLQSEGVNVTQASIDKKNSVSTSIEASSAAQLDNLVTRLIQSDKDKIFSDINTGGVVRNKNGGYKLNLSYKPSNKIIE